MGFNHNNNMNNNMNNNHMNNSVSPIPSCSVSPISTGTPRLECIEVPKVFDQCLLRRCLVFGNRETATTDPELRQVLQGLTINNVQRFVGCRNFQLVINNITKSDIAGQPGFVRLTLNFTINFFADVALTNGTILTVPFSVTRTEMIGSLYCPESIAAIAATRAPRQGSEPTNIDLDPEIIKLEMVAECLTADFVTLSGNGVALDVTLAFFMIVKCELVVQLLVQAMGYCPAPAPCSEVSPANLCEQFATAPVPRFFPLQKEDLPTTSGN